MYTFNDKLWPVTVFSFTGLQTLDEHEQSLALWDAQFARQETFVVVRLFNDEDSLVHPEGSAKVTKHWLRSGAAEAIKSRVAAMIIVVPESAYERMKHMSVDAVFGIPGGIFRNIEDAVKWFNASTGVTMDMRIDRQALQSGLTRLPHPNAHSGMA